MQQLPTADAYRTAMLNPSICFSDAELKGGKTSTNRQGLATVWSGQFASVFRIQTTAGIRAVRCFTSKISDQQDRYARFHAHIDNIGNKSLPMLAAFEYQPNGMRVSGAWYPIVKMEWVNGKKLDERVEELVAAHDIGKLSLLATQWLNLFIGLQQNQIAHGDLQHENILVNNGYLRLVDYDGVYVPSLSGRIGLEVGHTHYQHPRRTISDFNLGIDNFSALVIYLSLKALSVDPSLWNKFHKDKHLILRNDDFKSPSTSPVITALKASKNTEVCNLVSALESSCKASVSSVPSLNSLIVSASTTPPPNPANWRSSWVGMEPVVLPKTPSYTPPPTSTPPPAPPPTAYNPPQWQSSSRSSKTKNSTWQDIINWLSVSSHLAVNPMGFWKTFFVSASIAGLAAWVLRSNVSSEFIISTLLFSVASLAYLLSKNKISILLSLGGIAVLDNLLSGYWDWTSITILSIMGVAQVIGFSGISGSRISFIRTLIATSLSAIALILSIAIMNGSFPTEFSFIPTYLGSIFLATILSVIVTKIFGRG